MFLDTSSYPTTYARELAAQTSSTSQPDEDFVSHRTAIALQRKMASTERLEHANQYGQATISHW